MKLVVGKLLLASMWLLPLLAWSDAKLDAKVDEVVLHNGDVLHGEILKLSDTHLILQHPVLGKLKLERGNIASHKKGGQVETEVAKATEHKPEKPQAKPDASWKKSIAVGFSGAQGNSENNNLHVDFTSDYRTREQRHRFTTLYDGKTENGDTTENSFEARLQSDFFMPGSRWFWFTREQFDWDQFEEWDYRLGFYIGPGYVLVEEPNWKLTGKVGAGANKTWGDADEDLTPEALLGIDFEWAINSKQSLTAGNTIYPDLEEDGEFRNVTLLNWKIKATDIYKGASLKLGLSNEYDSTAMAPIEENDFKYNLSLDIEL
ncbi:MAG: DUF481 domain-containing protein [Chromatiales bacterium]|jgi:putative salt-induced outer membrane protein YdiY